MKKNIQNGILTVYEENVGFSFIVAGTIHAQGLTVGKCYVDRLILIFV
jgi:hypothetical protein